MSEPTSDPQVGSSPAYQPVQPAYVQPQYVQPIYVAPLPAPPRGMSIASLVLGLVGLFASWFLVGIPSILAIIFGHVGLRKEPAGKGMAVTGLVTGYLVVGLFVLGVVGVVIAYFVFGVALIGAGTAGSLYSGT